MQSCWRCGGAVLRRFSYSLRAISPLFSATSKPDISELTEKDLIELRPSSPPPPPPPPQIQLSIPLTSQIKNLLFPSRQVDILMDLVEEAKLNGPGCDLKYKQRVKTIIADILVTKDTMDESKIQDFMGFLLHASCNCENPQFLESVLTLVDRTKVVLGESHYNSILMAMDRHGWNRLVKRNFRAMLSRGIKCRLETIFTLVTSAVRRKDFDFGVELMLALTKGMYNHRRMCVQPFPMEVVVDGCVGSKDRGVELIEQVLEWHRMTEVTLSSNTIHSLIKWVQSLGRNHQIQNAEIHPDGECGSCGNLLECNKISEEDHRRILSETESVISNLEQRHYTYPKEYLLTHLKAMVRKHKFGAVVDGMNVAMRSRDFNVDRVLQVASDMRAKTSLPVLVVLKWYCLRWFSAHKGSNGSGGDTTKQSTLRALEKDYASSGIHFFFVYNYADDDLYSLYASLASGRDTYLVTNDHMRDKNAMLFESDTDMHLVLDHWKKGHVVSLSHEQKHTAIVMPLQYKRIVQWTKSGLWHLPYRQHSKEKTLCIKC